MSNIIWIKKHFRTIKGCSDHVVCADIVERSLGDYIDIFFFFSIY